MVKWVLEGNVVNFFVVGWVNDWMIGKVSERLELDERLAKVLSEMINKIILREQGLHQDSKPAFFNLRENLPLALGSKPLPSCVNAKGLKDWLK